MKKLSEKDKTLHTQFSRYGRNAREWMRKCVLLLPEIERNRVWEKKGFDDIYEYAAKLAGMGHDAVNDSLRILKKIEDKPLLMEVVEQKGINCIKPIVNLIDENNEKFWAEKAKIMSKNTLQVYAKAFRDDGRTGPSEMLDFPQKKAILILIDADVAERLEKLKGGGDWNDLMKEFLKLREEKLAAELKEIERKEIKKIIKKKNKTVDEVKQNEGSEIGGTILNEGMKTMKTMMAAAEQNNDNSETTVHKNDLYKAKNHQPSTKIKKYVLHKTNHTCAFPGCTKPAEHLHHTERFSISGRHDPDKIIPLCKEHHELAHDGLIENEDAVPSEWRVRRDTDFAYINDIKFLIDQRVAEYKRM